MFLALAAVAAACSLVTGLDGLTAGSSPTERDADAPGDVDAPFTDGSNVDPGSFCALHAAAAFCDDFDDDAALPRHWDDRTEAFGQVRLVLDGGALSGLGAILTQVDDKQGALASLGKTFPDGGQQVRIEWDMRFDEVGPGWSQLMNVGFGDTKAPGTAFAVYLRAVGPASDAGVPIVVGQFWQVPDGSWSSAAGALATAPVPLGVWSHYKLEVLRDSQTAHFFVDGASLGDIALDSHALLIGSSATVACDIGVTYGVRGPLAALTDNVVVTIQ